MTDRYFLVEWARAMILVFKKYFRHHLNLRLATPEILETRNNKKPRSASLAMLTYDIVLSLLG